MKLNMFNPCDHGRNCCRMYGCTCSCSCMYVYTVRSSRRSVTRPIAAITCTTDRRDDRVYVYTVRSSRLSVAQSVARLIATIDRTTDRRDDRAYVYTVRSSRDRSCNRSPRSIACMFTQCDCCGDRSPRRSPPSCKHCVTGVNQLGLSQTVTVGHA